MGCAVVLWYHFLLGGVELPVGEVAELSDGENVAEDLAGDGTDLDEGGAVSAGACEE
jgi:hypothetical protein